jgi:hypothetical protein
VRNVCGKHLQSGGGVIGCDRKCGVNNEHTCNFACGDDGCSGFCTTCKTGSRETTSGPVVRAELARRAIKRSNTGLPTYCQWCYASCPRWNWLCKVHCQSRGQCPPLSKSRIAGQ